MRVARSKRLVQNPAVWHGYVLTVLLGALRKQDPSLDVKLRLALN